MTRNLQGTGIIRRNLTVVLLTFRKRMNLRVEKVTLHCQFSLLLPLWFRHLRYNFMNNNKKGLIFGCLEFCFTDGQKMELSFLFTLYHHPLFCLFCFIYKKAGLHPNHFFFLLTIWCAEKKKESLLLYRKRIFCLHCIAVNINETFDSD